MCCIEARATWLPVSRKYKKNAVFLEHADEGKETETEAEREAERQL